MKTECPPNPVVADPELIAVHLQKNKPLPAHTAQLIWLINKALR